MKMIFLAFKKRGWRKVKEKGTIKLTAEERSNLERLRKGSVTFSANGSKQAEEY